MTGGSVDFGGSLLTAGSRVEERSPLTGMEGD